MPKTRPELVALWSLAVLPGLAFAADQAAEAHRSGSQAVRESTAVDEHLPAVLLIGDSIVNGYRGEVARLLDDKARVECWITGMNLASKGLFGQLAQVLRAETYEVVHFNIGLHGWQPGRIPAGQYEPLLRTYVKTLKENAPGARLIWASTTPVTVQNQPEKLDKEIEGTITRRNAIAAKVMRENGIEVNDLHALMVDKLSLARGDRFHWNKTGYAVMAKTVSAAILKALQSSK